MLIFTKNLRVCAAVEPCDLRARFERLSLVVRERLVERPHLGLPLRALRGIHQILAP